MFSKGTEWIRADFHLHTKADKEFSYLGEDDRFISEYVEKLVGVLPTKRAKHTLSKFRHEKSRYFLR